MQLSASKEDKMKQKNAVKLTGISFQYETGEALLKDISIDIKEGSCVLITGPSGCGKTTLTRLVNGLIPHYYEGTLSGDVFIKDKDIKDMEAWEYGLYVGSVFQDTRSQFFTSAVVDEIAFSPENYGKDPAIIRRQIDAVLRVNNISELKNCKLQNLSSGEKQKVAMAATQTLDPGIYVLDEPSANLDQAATAILAMQLKKLKEQGKTVLIADHRFYYLMDIIDEVFYMNNGMIEHTWNQAAFAALTAKELECYGLRSNNREQDTTVGLSGQDNVKKEAYLEISDLSVAYSKFSRPVLRNLNFSASKGEVVAITGKNGIGKTTLAKTLCGLLAEKSGDIRLSSKKYGFKKRREHFWFVLQDTDYQLFSDSVISEVLLGYKSNQAVVEQAEDILRKLDLWRYKDRHPATLSGGQKQRLTFAVGLMRNPEILILDEPTSGLDALNMKQIVRLIKDQAHKGTIVLVISHDHEFLDRNCDQIINIERIKETGMTNV